MTNQARDARSNTQTNTTPRTNMYTMRFVTFSLLSLLIIACGETDDFNEWSRVDDGNYSAAEGSGFASTDADAPAEATAEANAENEAEANSETIVDIDIHFGGDGGSSDAPLCDTDADCSSNEYCNSQGYCLESLACTSDDDCVDGGVCTDGGLCQGAQGEQGEAGEDAEFPGFNNSFEYDVESLEECGDGPATIVNPYFDANFNNEFDADEFGFSFYVCHPADGESCDAWSARPGCVSIHCGGEWIDDVYVGGEFVEELCAGADGADGANGLACWDLNGDGVRNEDEDINVDGTIDALDCIGSDGADGSDGTHGTDGASGTDGSNGTDGAGFPFCYDEGNECGTGYVCLPNGQCALEAGDDTPTTPVVEALTVIVWCYTDTDGVDDSHFGQMSYDVPFGSTDWGQVQDVSAEVVESEICFQAELPSIAQRPVYVDGTVLPYSCGTGADDTCADGSTLGWYSSDEVPSSITVNGDACTVGGYIRNRGYEVTCGL